LIDRVFEVLPAAKEEMERALLEKFAECFRMANPDLSVGSRVPPHDGRLRLGHTLIEVELVEIADDEVQRRRAAREHYFQALKAAVADELPKLDGLVIQFHDGYQPNIWPSMRREPGRDHLDKIVHAFRAMVPSLGSVANRKVIVRELYQAADGFSASIYGHREHSNDSGIPVEFTCNQAFVTSPERVERLLADTILAKIRKGYARSSANKLWLVAYALPNTIGALDAEAIRRARRILRNQQHAFDEIWAFFPMPDRAAVSPTRIWPE
jgi:hypothetical protein